MKEEATIFDYARMCKKHKHCLACSLNNRNNGMNVGCAELIREYPIKANEIILNWCKEHPVEARQNRFLKMFPNAQKIDDGVLGVCPRLVDKTVNIICPSKSCLECHKDYWLAEVEE